ncbi:MAG: hypothetical protein ACLQKA_18930 [Bryobacteraceae bacterium]
MLKIAATLILASFCGQVGFTQPAPSTGFADGRTWNIMSDETKSWYLIGFRDAMGFSGTVKQYWGDFTALEYKKELDKLYGEGENLQIPVWMAFRYVSLKLGGTNKRDFLEQFLIDLRATAKKNVVMPK